jgi:predicted methyltransferase
MRWALAVSVVAVSLVCAGCTQCKRFAYSGFGRDGWQQPERVVESLALEPGNRVADLGAGGGYFTGRLAEAVGPDGLVYAVDVDEPLLSDLGERIAAEGHGNVETVLAHYDDPLLPETGVDLLFTVNTYHHLEERSAYFENARRYLRPGGRVAIIEFDGGGFFQRLFPHYTEPETIREEMSAAGYSLVADHDFLERQSFLVFAPR